MEPRWLALVRRLLAVAQNGLTYARDPFDRERYEETRKIAAELMAAGAGVETERVLEVFSDTGYATPRLDVRAVALRGGRMLLVREKTDGLWSLPGGWADVGTPPAANVEREVREEAGFTARATRLLAVYDRSLHIEMHTFPFHIYKLFFLCELTGETGAAGNPETDGVGFFSPDELPPLSHSRVTEKQVRRMFELAARPDLPADFD